MTPPDAEAALWADAVRAAALFAVDPTGLTGISLRAAPGPVRERWLSLFRGLLPREAPVRRLPLNVSDSRLLGGLDLAATLRTGRPVAERGVLAEANGGIVIAAMAERLSAATAARLAAVLDSGEVTAERDGLALRAPARIGVVALDESIEADERVPAVLLDRLAFHFDLNALGLRHAIETGPSADMVASARALLPKVTADEDVIRDLCGAAATLGIASLRAPWLALRAALAAAALAGRHQVEQADATLAGRLVFASRATVVPAAEPPPEDRRPAETPPQSAQNNADPQAPSREEQPADADRMEMVVEAARSAIPADLLAQLQSGQATRSRSQSMGRAGARQSAALRGRPIGVRRGAPRGGGRLNVVETLRAAAPWQTVRHRERAVRAAAGAMPRVEVRAEDFRVSRFAHRSETTTIFVVDASGSSAMHRLAEAKGAVELLLQDCYVRRDRVAVIAFRRAAAELMLPPTRSLVRAKRSLAGLPGGGGTPLASAIDAALALAEKVRRGGETPVVILLTDGRANVARDGAGNRARAETDALSAARSLRAAAVTSLLIDTAPHAQPATRRLAQEMGARYLPMPHADAVALSGAARAAVQPSSGARRPNVR